MPEQIGRYEILEEIGRGGTLYPQLMTSQSTNQVADYSRLSAEVDEEVRVLPDHLAALEKVKPNRAGLP